MLECAQCQAETPPGACRGWTYATVTLTPIDPATPPLPETLARDVLCPACSAKARAELKDPHVPPEAHD